MKQDFEYTTARGHQTSVTLYGSDLPAKAVCVIYLHGFKGFKDWGWVPYIALNLEEYGIRLLAPNFSHNGIGDVPDQFTELDKFRDNTFSLELEEAIEFAQAYCDGRFGEVDAAAPLVLLGHSRGGGIALLAAHAMPRVRCVCTWAAVSTFARYPQATLDAWQAVGTLDVVNARTGQVMQLGYQLHADLLAHVPGRLDIEAAVRALPQPLCVIHGTADQAVPMADAEAIISWAKEGTAFYRIEDADHVMNIRHPWAGTSPALEQALSMFTDFLHTVIYL
jgi:pimeloyl-ACP methyl ester carboxylesterase